MYPENRLFSQIEAQEAGDGLSTVNVISHSMSFAETVIHLLNLLIH